MHQSYNIEPVIPSCARGCECKMTHKRNVVLYLDDEIVKKTRELGFNLSKTCENHLKQLINSFQSIYSSNMCEKCVVGSPGGIRTLVSGSRAQCIQDNSLIIDDIDKIVTDFWEYLKVEERLSKEVSKDYKNVAKRFLKLSVGKVSRMAVREFLKLYVDKAPRTYNNIIDALKAFIGRYLQRIDLLNSLKHTYVPENYEQHLPTKEQLKKGFEALDTDKEKAIYLFFATTGLRRSEALNLSKDDVHFDLRCVKAKHDTRTKRAGVTFYNEECEKYLQKYLASRNDDNSRLFRIGHRQFRQIWQKASEAADCRIRPQVLRKWHSTMLGELMVPDRFVDVFQGRAPKNVLARHYTGNGLERLKRIYDKAGFKVLS